MLTQTGVSHNETQMSISDKNWINIKTSCSHCLSHINSESLSASPNLASCLNPSN